VLEHPLDEVVVLRGGGVLRRLELGAERKGGVVRRWGGGGGVGPARRSGGTAWSVAVLTGSARPTPKQGRAWADRWAPATVPSGGGLNTFQIQTNSNYLKTFQTLTDPKTTLPSPKKLK
jgi:hypothetical protein